MPSVGANSYITLDAEPAKPAERLELLRRLGVNGVALRATGFRGRIQRRRAVVDVEAASAAALKAEMDTHYALQGTGVAVVDNHGVTWGTVGLIWIVEVRVTAEKIVGGVGGLAGTDATHMLTVDFLWVDTSTA